ncbi:MAG: VOC family protein [Burkholderiales bacterium]|nr:VOC family protein [Burkholderiales bacterium]
MSHLPGKFVWFEHLSADVSAARRFYEGLFGWHVELMPMGEQRYPLILNGTEGIGGFGTASAETLPQWRSYLSVPDVDASYRLSVAAGAQSLQGPTDYGDVGRCAVIQDPTGATVALWHGSQGDAADVPQVPAGAFCWAELWTPNVRRAIAFYEQLVGYQHETLDMGAQGPYTLLSRGGQQRAGLMACPDANTPPMWLPYVAVADAEATEARVAALGGRSLMPLTEVPNVGRMGMLVDPQGASIAFMQLNPTSA